MRSENTTRLPTLGNSNKLVCVDGVWRQASQASGIDYSDGHEEESILHETLTQANNLAWVFNWKQQRGRVRASRR